jgi:hypothetical protein
LISQKLLKNQNTSGPIIYNDTEKNSEFKVLNTVLDKNNIKTNNNNIVKYSGAKRGPKPKKKKNLDIKERLNKGRFNQDNKSLEKYIKKSKSKKRVGSTESIFSTNNCRLASQSNNAFFTEINKNRILNDSSLFSINSLFHSSNSLLTKLDLKSFFQPSIFESLPRQSQLKLIKLLPECDRQLDSHGSFK